MEANLFSGLVDLTASIKKEVNKSKKKKKKKSNSPVTSDSCCNWLSLLQCDWLKCDDVMNEEVIAVNRMPANQKLENGSWWRNITSYAVSKGIMYIMYYDVDTDFFFHSSLTYVPLAAALAIMNCNMKLQRKPEVA